MDITGSVALVTGANRGFGAALTDALLEAGAARVYAGAREVSSVAARPGVHPVALDVTDPASVAAAAALAGDVTLVFNNAGIGSLGGILDVDAPERLRREMEVNVLGLLGVGRAFGPMLATNGGGALVNILSVVSWVSSERLATYSASKSAAWSGSNALRVALRPGGTLVTGVHFGYLDTDLTTGIDAPKGSPAEAARTVLEQVASGAEEVLFDELTRKVKAGLSGGVEVLYPRPAAAQA
jgi:NAD(P)-dependent dehydrogenase (short-subunit alcohol dehydrogenase family)